MTRPTRYKVGPRCGKPMRLFETPSLGVRDKAVCGRPLNHKGQCRSEEAMNNKRELERKNSKRLP
jgi:hypothetical protein